MDTKPRGQQNNVRYVKRISVCWEILGGSAGDNTTERRKETKDAGILEAKDEGQLDEITSGKEQNTQNGTECQFPAECEFSAVGKDFHVFFILSPLT